MMKAGPRAPREVVGARSRCSHASRPVGLTPGSALWLVARPVRGENREAHLSAEPHAPHSYPRVPRAHEDRGRSFRDQEPPRQGPSAPVGHDVREVASRAFRALGSSSLVPFDERGLRQVPARASQGGFPRHAEVRPSAARRAPRARPASTRRRRACASGSRDEPQGGHRGAAQRHPSRAPRGVPPAPGALRPGHGPRGDRQGRLSGPCICGRACGDSRRPRPPSRGWPTATPCDRRSGRHPYVIRAVLLLLLRVYRAVLSPLFGNVCRFEPSCSRYASACIERFGAARGTLLAARRLAKCHPFHPGGFDPPPQLHAHCGACAPTDGRP